MDSSLCGYVGNSIEAIYSKLAKKKKCMVFSIGVIVIQVTSFSHFSLPPLVVQHSWLAHLVGLI